MHKAALEAIIEYGLKKHLSSLLSKLLLGKAVAAINPVVGIGVKLIMKYAVSPAIEYIDDEVAKYFIKKHATQRAEEVQNAENRDDYIDAFRNL